MYDIEYSRMERSYILECEQGGRPHLQNSRARYWAASDLDLTKVPVYADQTGRPTPGRRLDPKNRVGDDYRVPVPKKAKRAWFPISELSARVECPDYVIYCWHCSDHLTVEWGCSRAPCRHVSYCEKCGVWSTPQERCPCDTRKEVK